MRVNSAAALDLQTGDLRLDASYHANPGQQAIRKLTQSGKKLERLDQVCLPRGIFIPGRFKRIFVDNPLRGAPYVTGGSILQAEPLQGAKLLSFRFTADMDRLALQEKMILITCSGEIGNVVYVNDIFKGAVGSPDLIRILADPPKTPSGHLYAYLSSSLARTLIQQKTYGAVIPHIEAHHVFDLPIPRLEPEQEERIHRLIEQASEKRVHANKCITKAQEKLDTLLFGKNASQGDLINKKHNEFKLGITDSSFIYNGDFRLDANYHVIHGKRVASWLSEKGIELERLDAVCIPGGVFIPGRFKRIFVEDSHHGAPYLTGSFVIRLKPLQGVKLLSRHQIENKNELVLRDKMILITCSGEIGNTVYVNANFLGSVGSPDLIRVVFNPHKISPGYLYAYLHSPLARMLIQQKTYGAVIPHIEAHHLYDLLIPRFNSDQEIYIDQLIEEASDLQVKANELEDQAQQFLNGYLE